MGTEHERIEKKIAKRRAAILQAIKVQVECDAKRAHNEERRPPDAWASAMAVLIDLIARLEIIEKRNGGENAAETH